MDYGTGAIKESQERAEFIESYFSNISPRDLFACIIPNFYRTFGQVSIQTKTERIMKNVPLIIFLLGV